MGLDVGRLNNKGDLPEWSNLRTAYKLFPIQS